MTTQSIVCGSCSAAVPYGRLSCPECGELLASVAGSRRVRAGAVTRATAVSLVQEGSTGAAATSVKSVVLAKPSATPRPLAVAIPEPVAAEPEFSEPALEAWDADLPEPVAESMPQPEPAAGLGFEFAPIADLDGDNDTDDDADAYEPPWFTAAAPDDRLEPSVLMAVATPSDDGAERWAPSYAATAAPGAYVPPPPFPAILAGAPAPARTWAGHADNTAAADTKAASADDAAATRMDEFVRWLAVAGSTLSAVGFLLPMASSVIGSTGGGYLDRWGLAGPFHLVLVVGLLAILALALAADRIPLWIRVGLPGLGLGALLIGLVWPYLLVSALDAGPGTFAILVGAVMLGIAGVVALVTGRHAIDDRAV